MMKPYKKRIAICIMTLIFFIGLLCAGFIMKKVIGFLDHYTYLSNSVDRLNGYVDNSIASLDQYKVLTDDMEILVNQARDWVDYEFDYTWAENSPNLIAHAMGGIHEKTYTNSLEAFEYNYGLGYRLFEVDFMLTQPENTLVAAHDVEQWQSLVDNNTPPPIHTTTI